MVLLGTAGCSWLPYAVRNTLGVPLDRIKECAFRRHLQKIARQTWTAMQRQDPKTYSPAFVKGFEDGFVDFIDRDGIGEPPAIPPQCYRHDVLRSPRGQIEIEDWYAGYRFGAQTARATGMRERVTIPISAPPRFPANPIGNESVQSESLEKAPQSLENMPTPVGPADEKAAPADEKTGP